MIRIFLSLFEFLIAPLNELRIFFRSPASLYKIISDKSISSTFSLLFWSVTINWYMTYLHADARAHYFGGGSGSDLNLFVYLFHPVKGQLIAIALAAMYILSFMPTIWIYSKTFLEAMNDKDSFHLVVFFCGVSFLLKSIIMIPSAIRIHSSEEFSEVIINAALAHNFIASLTQLIVFIVLHANLKNLKKITNVFQIFVGVISSLIFTAIFLFAYTEIYFSLL